MADTETLESISSEGLRLLELARSDPDRQVPHYPDWTLRDLIAHTARIHARTTVTCKTLPSEPIAPDKPPADRDVFDWYAETLPAMVRALAEADGEADVWALTPERRIGSWERRMAIETGVHRWDASDAFGEPAPLSSLVSTLGLDEFDQLWLERLGDISTLRLEATDIGRSWTYGAGEPSATVRATASDLYLRLMARPGAELPADWLVAVDDVPRPKN
jgi:uncharacterized protein (TIGR03083 family)